MKTLLLLKIKSWLSKKSERTISEDCFISSIKALGWLITGARLFKMFFFNFVGVGKVKRLGFGHRL